MLPKYEVKSLLGRGGMGAVYLGRQDALDRPVAIKILPPGLEQIDPAYGARFRQEAMSLAKLNHPGIVAVYDFGCTEQGLWYIVMEYVDGTDVAQMLAKKGQLSSQDAMAITAHVCDALQYAHARGIIHRDIKPANIMVGYNGVVKVADFGLARMNRGEQSSLTQSGMAMGTMHYIAPEALILGNTVDHRADIYAMGVMLYQMLTGDLPRGMFELPSHKVAGLDPRYDKIITRTLQSDREQRYPSVKDLRHDLDAILTEPVTQVDPNAAEAPAALNTTARPQRPAGQPYRPPQGAAKPTPRKKKSDMGFWLPVSGIAFALAAFFVWTNLLQPVRKTIQRIEGEALEVLKVTGGVAEPQAMKQTNALWSGDAHLWWYGGEAGNSLDLEFTVAEGQAGKQRLKAAFTSSSDYGIVEISLDGEKLKGSIFDLQANYAVITGARDLGLYDLAAGSHMLRIAILDTSCINMDKRVAYNIGLDYLQLEPPVRDIVPAATGTNIAVKAQPSASFCSPYSHVHVRHLSASPENAGRKSSDEGLPQQAWHPHKGSAEWVQYEWESPQVIGECRVFWYDDSAVRRDGCALPAFWRLLYREEITGAWVPVQVAIPSAERDTWNSVKFPAVRTTALRIAVQCLDGLSAGICHWQVLAADPASLPDPKTYEHPDLFLGDLSPLHAHTHWSPYWINTITANDRNAHWSIMVGRKPCWQFLFAHAHSRLDFAIPAGYTRFTAFGVGVSDVRTGEVMSQGHWKHRVLVDGKVLQESNELSTYKDHEFGVDVNFPAGSKVLTLINDPLGSRNSDYAHWAYPTLLSAESQKLPSTATVSAHALALLFPPKKIPEGALLTSTLSTARMPSKRQGEKFGLRFINMMPETVKLYWLSGDKQHLYHTMLPGDERVMITYDGHVWLITNAADEPLACIMGSPSHPVVVVDSAGRGLK